MVTASYDQKSCIFLILTWLQKSYFVFNCHKTSEMLYIINLYINDKLNMSLRYFFIYNQHICQNGPKSGPGSRPGPLLGHNFLIFVLISTIVGSNTIYSSRQIYWKSNINDTTIMGTDIHFCSCMP